MEEDIEFQTFDGDTITKSDYRNEIIQEYKDANREGLTKITDFNIGSEAYHLADIIANLRLENRIEVDNNYRMMLIHTKEGEFLDDFGDTRGIHRKGSSPSTGNVTFTRLSSITGQIIIPDGTVVATDDAISFIVDNDGENVIIAANENTATCKVLCEQDGAFTNVEPNTITLVMGNVGSLVSVTNASKFTEGEDIESDDDYRNRILESSTYPPTGTLAWYKNISEELDLVHDVRVRKGTLVSEDDIIITYVPNDWTKSTETLAELTATFNLEEYDMAGITVGYLLATKTDVLKGTSSETYLFSVLLKTGYTLSELKTEIISKINAFNSDARVSVEFNPNSLAAIIENEVTGVSVCRIVKRTGTSPNYTYEEVTSTTSISDDNIYNIDTTDLTNRIVNLSFNIDLEVDDS